MITVDELATYLRQEVSMVTQQQQTPILADISQDPSQGSFFFFNRQRQVASGLVKNWDPSRLTPFGVTTEQRFLEAKRLYEAQQYAEAKTLFEKASHDGHAQAARYVGLLYGYGQGCGRTTLQPASGLRRPPQLGMSAHENV